MAMGLSLCWTLPKLWLLRPAYVPEDVRCDCLNKQQWGCSSHSFHTAGLFLTMRIEFPKRTELSHATGYEIQVADFCSSCFFPNLYHYHISSPLKGRVKCHCIALDIHHMWGRKQHKKWVLACVCEQICLLFLKCWWCKALSKPLLQTSPSLSAFLLFAGTVIISKPLLSVAVSALWTVFQRCVRKPEASWKHSCPFLSLWSWLSVLQILTYRKSIRLQQRR